MKSKSVHIHFVCTGNIYRSRLAEAYLHSKQIPNIEVSSSGTEANTQNKGPISWYAQRLLQRNNLTPYMSTLWAQTTPSMLHKASLVVFIGPKNYEKFKKDKQIKKCAIWDIPDFDDSHLNKRPFNPGQEMEYVKVSENVFSMIKEKVDELVKNYK